MSEALRPIQDELREELVREVGRSRFRLWFRDTVVEDVDESSVTIAVPTEVHRTWLQYTYGDVLTRAVGTVLGDGVDVHLEVSRAQGIRREMRDRLPARNQDWAALLDRRRPQPRLESFVCGSGERFPPMLLAQLVHGNGTVNPPAVYLYGEHGTGKTHLLAGLQAASDALGPGDAVYLTSRRFTSRFVSALRAKEMDALRAFEVDLCHRRIVLIDDVNSLAGRTATQAALVRLRERAHGTRTRFVFTSSRHPRELEDVSPRLRSWFMGGVLLRLKTPDRGWLDQILVQRAQSYGLGDVEQNVLDWVHERTSSIHGAVEVMDRWGAASAEMGRPLGVEWLPEIAPSVTATARQEIIRRAKEAVSSHYGIAPHLLNAPTKVRSAALPRRVAMYLVYRAAALPLKELGAAFGLKSHSSVSRAIRQIREEREGDPALEHVVDGLLARM